jgi:hypothetical protein
VLTAAGAKVVPVEERAGVVLPPKAAERDRPRMDPPNVLWFFGAFAIELGVYALLRTIPTDQRGLWILVAAVGFFVAFAAASWMLLGRWWVPGGLAAALAVGMFPAVSVAFLKLIRVWPNDPFFRPFTDFNAYWVGVSAATALVGLFAFALTRFPFILAVAIGAVVVGSQLFVPCFEERPTGDDRTAAALVVGAVLVIIGVFVDAFGRRRGAFWFHALGWLTAAGGLVFLTAEGRGDTDRGWVPMLIVSVLMLLIAGPIRRATWAVYGVLGFYAAVIHYLTKGLNESRWPFALVTLIVGLSIFAFGLVVHRYGKAWAGRFVRRPPPTLSP